MENVSEETTGSAMMREVAEVKAAAKSRVAGVKVEDEELPQGSSKVTQSASSAESTEETSEETSGKAEGESSEVDGVTEGSSEPDEAVTLDGKTFKNQREALVYAEQLAREREIESAHAAGMREAIQAQTAGQQPAPEPEDDFEQRFYANPKETLKTLQSQARDEAVAVIRAEQQREKIWGDFLSENPDIRRKDAERVLQENWDTIGKVTDLKKGQQILARMVRDEYAEISQLMKPRTTLEKKTQAVSPSGGSRNGVTPVKKEEKVLSMAEQMRSLRK